MLIKPKQYSATASFDSARILAEDIIRFGMTRLSFYDALVGSDEQDFRAALAVIDTNWEAKIPKNHELEIVRQTERTEALIFFPDRDILTILLPSSAPIKIRAVSATLDPSTPMSTCTNP